MDVFPSRLLRSLEKAKLYDVVRYGGSFVVRFAFCPVATNSAKSLSVSDSADIQHKFRVNSR